jgi:hypothetical protein
LEVILPNRKLQPPFGLIIASVLLVIWGLVYKSVILVTILDKTQINPVILIAIPFISYFMASLLVYIFVVNVVSHILSYRIPENIYRLINIFVMAGIVGGVMMIFQPFSLAAYKPSFMVVLISLLGFILWSHVSPLKLVDDSEE